MNRVWLATSNGIVTESLEEKGKEDCLETLFAGFLPDAESDIGGVGSANRFRILFFGENALYRFFHLTLHVLGIRKHFIPRDDLIFLIHKYGGRSCQEAGDIINKALDQRICYATRKSILKLRVRGQAAWIEEEEKKYFILRKQAEAGLYYLIFTD